MRELQRPERERRVLVDHAQAVAPAELERRPGVVAGPFLAARRLEDREHRERVRRMDALRRRPAPSATDSVASASAGCQSPVR